MSTVTSPSDTTSETPGYIGLEVPGEPGVYFCARHKNVKVRLRCGRCETPICPKCTVMTPVGARCKNCGTNRSSHIFQITPLHALVALGVSLALGALGAFIASLGSSGCSRFFMLPLREICGRAVVKAHAASAGQSWRLFRLSGSLSERSDSRFS
jgi:hypothetical protein